MASVRPRPRALLSLAAAIFAAACFGDLGPTTAGTAGATATATSSSTSTSTGDAPTSATTHGTVTASTSGSSGPDPGTTTTAGDPTTGSSGAVCGNGVLEPGEGCDEGPTNGADAACTLQCQIAICGDGLVCPTCGEQCDGSSDCADNCQFATRVVFVTSKVATGAAFGGLAGADIACNEAAAANPALGGRTFVAWLSSSTIDARDRIGLSQVPYRRLDNFEVAANTDDLVDGVLSAPIAVDETGLVVADGAPVWTGTMANGLRHAQHCENWLTSATFGRIGVATAINHEWSESAALDCGQAARFYCFQVAD